MQSDSQHCSTVGHIKESSEQVVTQGPLVKSYNCTKCPIVFKSKVYLFEHLNKVHCLNVDAALRGANLKYAESYKAITDDSKSPEELLKCQHCDFTTFSQDVLTKHKKLCHKTENANWGETVVIPDNPDIEVSELSPNQCNEVAEDGEGHLGSTSKSKCTPNASKDLKMYKRPPQTTTKFFTPPSGSSDHFYAKLVDETKETLILQETPSISTPSNWSGVCKVTATSLIDISSLSNNYLRCDQLLIPELRPTNPNDQSKEVQSNIGKRTTSDGFEGTSAKKFKSGKEKAALPEGKNVDKQPSGSTDFLFEVSDDEGGKNAIFDKEDQPNPKVYFCKHCDYSDRSYKSITSHYWNDHPYVRCNALYIQNSHDRSATFRCLECPVEFSTSVDLKWHYTEKHPEAPDVFNVKLKQLGLIFKCFSCPFTTNELKALRKHYKEKHPTYQVDNSLLFCQYSVHKCQEEPPQVQTCEKPPSPKKFREKSPEKVVTLCEEVRDAPSPQHPTCKEPVVAMYKCIKCAFRHKSAVVMHVHYKRNHQSKAVTIDKIKQLQSDTLHETSQVVPKNESSQKAKQICEMSQQKKITVFLSKLTSEDSKRPEFPTTKQVESGQDENTKMSPSKPKRRINSGLDNLSSGSPGELYYCKHCDYTNPKIKSVIGHHYSKHHEHSIISSQDIIQYSADVRTKKHKSQDPKARKGVKKSSKSEARFKEGGAVDSSVKGSNAYANAENLFYCQKCNVGKPTIKGVLNHQIYAHESLNSNSEQVVQHTALICAKIRRVKSLGKSALSSTYLPLPILNKGDEKMFFCNLCNFRQTSVTRVLRHYANQHQSSAKKSAVILQYTSRVLKQAKKTLPKSATDHKLQQKPDIKKKNANKLVKTSSDSAPLSVGDSGRQRNLRCHACTYSTQYVSHLKSHMRKAHRSNRKVKDVLQLCFRQGMLEAGYHCEWCVFSHQNAEAIYKHYKESHPHHKISLECILNRLFVGPKSAHHGNDVDSSLTSNCSRQNESETYSCPKCSYTSRSKSSLSRHNNEFHPSLDSSLDPQSNKGASTKSQLEELSNIPGVFESFQVPLEEADEATTSSTVFEYPSCSTTFATQHDPHSQKQLNLLNVQEQKKQPVNSKIQMHVLKCDHCNFISTIYKNILSHCQMRHPSVTSKVVSLYVDPAHLHNRDEYMRKNEAGENFKLSGYMCKTCPQICASLDKLNRHCKQKHNEALPSMLKPATKSSAKHCSTRESVSKASFFSKHKYAKLKCQHCAYFCNKRLSLRRHMLKEHLNTFSKDHINKCMLCPRIYFTKNALGKHYVNIHGKASYLKNFVPEHKQILQKPTSQDHPSTRQEQNKSSGEKRSVYRCPRCAYVHVSCHGVLTHCQMKHPTFTARTDKLKTSEIFVSDIVRCSTGKGSYERGYQCKKCPQIHPSLAMLKVHSHKHGKMETSELSAGTEAENPAVDNPPSSAYDPDPSKNKTPQENATETVPSLCTSITSNSPSSQKKDSYKCQVCMYATYSRANLRSHYKQTHKFNAVTLYKLLEKYNKRKRNYLLDYAEYKKGQSVKCKKCPDLTFDSSQSLIDHYCNFHQLGCKSDFTVVSSGHKHKTTGMYRCVQCMIQLNGIRKLCYHLDRHKTMLLMKARRKKASLTVSSSPDPQPIELCRQDEVPMFENLEELSKWSGAPVEAIVLPSSPRSSPAKVTEGEPEADVKKDQHSCKQCHRTFRSLKGLRSHEHGHAALAAIKKRDNQPELNQDIKGFVLYRMGNLKPLLCSCCTYRTNLMGLMQSHILKNHQDIIQKNKNTVENNSEEEEIPQKEDDEPSESSEKTNIPELDEEPEETEESLYSEHEDVQRQLNHYSLMAQNTDGSNGNVLKWMRPQNSHIYCEMCTFSTEHLSSIRRHYVNRHGKRLLKCKDCEFVTGLRKTLELHIQMGHSTYQSEPTDLKNLRCPFCLYQTKNKNRMIDHIVLHREERVVPIEVRRPKLSRYLQGIVFRCHKCTFSSGIAENLHLHMTKHHNDVRPYQCRLCYFDCTQLTELEAHLSDKHQVLRNHELVGQVILDQINVGISGMPERDNGCITNSKGVENEKFVPDCDQVPQNNIAEYDGEGKTFLPREEIKVKQEWEENNESPAESSVSDFQLDDAQPITAVQRIHEQNSQTQEVNVGLHHSAEGHHVGNAEDNNNVDEREENRTRLTDELNEEAAEGKLLRFKMEHSQEGEQEFQQKTQSSEATLEDDTEHRVLPLDEDGSKSHEWENQKLTIKIEQNIEENSEDSDQSEDTDQSNEDLSNNPVGQEGSTTFTHNPEAEASSNSVSANMSNAQTDSTKSQWRFESEKYLPTLSPGSAQLNINYKDTLSALLPSSKLEQMQTPTTCKDTLGPYGERPVLENESHKEEQDLITHKEEEENHQQEEEAEMMTEDETQCKEQDFSNIYHESMTTDRAAEDLHDDKRFTCQYCGRNLMNGSELNRHIVRHGL